MSKQQDKLEKLFNTLIDTYIDKLNDGEATSADCANIRNLLRDNGITTDLSNLTEPTGKIKSSLPELPVSNITAIK